MEYNVRDLNLPATLVHSVNGTKYRLDGTLIDINESKGICTIKFGNQVCDCVPLSETYLSEGVWDTIKSTAEKVKDGAVALWDTLMNVVRKVKGFLFPMDEKGNILYQYINTPINVATMNLGSKILFSPSDNTLVSLDENDMDTSNIASDDDIIAEEGVHVSKEGNEFFGRLMKLYTQNESVTINDAVSQLHESYKNVVSVNDIKKSNSLNESIATLDASSDYGTRMSSKDLIDTIVTYVENYLTAVESGYKTENAPLIWGAPGIGKTAIISNARQLIKERLGYDMDFVYVNCNGLLREDFQLPTSAQNAFGQAQSDVAPLSWLPCYDTKGLSDEQIKILDDYYNSGEYKQASKNVIDAINAQGDKKIKTNTKDSKNNAKCGGIIFFDEFSRVDSYTSNILMGLIGDHKFEQLQMASKWICIGASNTHSDDDLPTDDPEFRGKFNYAKDQRFEHYHYTPTRIEWLKWARDVNPKTGEQNIDEIFCEFIEQMKDGVWYKTLEYSFDDPTDKDVVSDNLRTAIANKDYDEIDNLKNTKEENKDRYSHGSWTPRTWEQNISNVIKVSLRNLFRDDKDAYDRCFKNVEHSKDVLQDDGTFSTEAYMAKNLNLVAIGKELDKLPPKKWTLWATTSGRANKIDPKGELYPYNRLGYFKKYISFVIGVASGSYEDSPLRRKWDVYSEWEMQFTDQAIQQIWNTGTFMSREWAKDDNITYNPSQQSEYSTTKFSIWKANSITVERVMDKIVNGYPGDLASDMESDIKKIVKLINTNNGQLPAITTQDVEKIFEEFNFELVYNNDQKKIIYSLLPPDGSKGSKNDIGIQWICKILKYSEVARKFAHMATWLVKIARQAHNGLDVNTLIENIERQVANVNANSNNIRSFIKMYKDSQFPNTDYVFSFLTPTLQILSHFKNLNIK